MSFAQTKNYSKKEQFVLGSILHKIRADFLFSEDGKGKKTIIGYLYKAKENVQSLT